MTIDHPCHICGGTLQGLQGFDLLVQVTSDCRPWQSGGSLASCATCGTVQKPAAPAWQRQADAIYSGYEMYRQGDGAEQSAFDAGSGASTARSNRIVEWLNHSGQLPAQGKMLDIGCGNGSFLAAFSARYKAWQLAGLELDDRNGAVIQAIPGVTQLYIGRLADVPERFDLIVLIHALEHIPAPATYLASLKQHLSPGGLLLVEVPDLPTSPFDILIADHATHFTAGVLQAVAAAAGFATLALESGFVPKELALLARSSDQPLSPSQPAAYALQEGRLAATGHIAWLHNLLARTQDISGNCGIFGTSISATWLAASMPERIAFFVDEDVNRIGRTHMGRPILAPDATPRGATVLVPLRADIATAVAQRLAYVDCHFVLPSA